MRKIFSIIKKKTCNSHWLWGAKRNNREINTIKIASLVGFDEITTFFVLYTVNFATVVSLLSVFINISMIWCVSLKILLCYEHFKFEKLLKINRNIIFCWSQLKMRLKEAPKVQVIFIAVMVFSMIALLLDRFHYSFLNIWT